MSNTGVEVTFWNLSEVLKTWPDAKELFPLMMNLTQVRLGQEEFCIATRTLTTNYDWAETWDARIDTDTDHRMADFTAWLVEHIHLQVELN